MHSTKTPSSRLIGFFILITMLFTTACTSDDSDIITVSTDDATSINNSNLSATLSVLPLETISQEEADGLYYMREEEKLAHDVYSVLFDITGQNIFNNISNSEQTHTDAVKLIIERYSLIDPVTDTTIGVFQNSFLQSLYNTLTAQGSASLIDALLVGAAIEEIDIIDIQTELDTHVDNQDIIIVYESLLLGSRNHLRSFVANLENQGMTYTPQYLDQSTYDNIINSTTETQ